MLYATSNRRHILARDMIENEQATGIHSDEAVEEKVSLADRFGLRLGFYAIDQDGYLDMVLAYTTYRLAAAVRTQDLACAHRLAKRLEAGTVYLNAQGAWDPALPLGGHKQSGWGHKYGVEGVEGFMKTKSMYVGMT